MKHLWQRIKCAFGLHEWQLHSYDPEPAGCAWVEWHECKHCERHK